MVTADLTPDFSGEPPFLLSPFGAAATLLEATLARLVHAELAPITVAYRRTRENQALPELLSRLPIETLEGSQSDNEAQLMAAAVKRSGEQTILAANASSPFVSPTVLRAQLEAHARLAKEVTLAPLAAHGLAAVVLESSILPRLGQFLEGRYWLDPQAALFRLQESLRGPFEIADAPTPRELVCMPITLECRTLDDVPALSPHALRPGDESYGPIFDALCAAEWNRWRTRSARAARPRKPKVLFASYTTSHDTGTTSALRTTLEYWNRDQFDMVVALPNRGAFFRHCDARYPVREVPTQWTSVPPDRVPGSRWLDEVRACVEFVRAEAPDVAYFAGTVPAMALACKLAGIPSLSTMYLPLMTFDIPTTGDWARRAYLPLYDIVAAPAAWSEQLLRDAFRPPPGRLTTVECCAPLEKFDPARYERAAARERLGLPADASVMSVVGMLVPLKQSHLAIEALPFLSRKVPSATVAFAGQERIRLDYNQQTFEARARELGVAERLRFLGFVDDVAAVYAASDVILHCAMGDQFPQAILEAMSMGKPVVAVADGGALEIIVDGETGLLVPPPGKPEELADALARVLTSEDRGASLGAAGRKRVVERFDARRLTDRLQNLCLRLMAGELAD